MPRLWIRESLLIPFGAEEMAVDPEIEMGATEVQALSEEDIRTLTSVITRIVEGMVGKITRDTLPALIKPQVDQALKAMIPSLVESAVGEEKVLIKETTQEVTRQALPAMVAPLLDRLAKEIIEEQVRKVIGEVAKEIIEKVTWEVVPSQAEIEIKKEIERLTTET